MMTTGLQSEHVKIESQTAVCPSFGSVSNITKAEARRYSRQLILPELGLRGFKNLRASAVLVVGAGGLGTSACVHLAANGIGAIGIVDYDVIEESNLPRQITYRRSDVGRKKVDALAEVCRQQNPGDVRIITYDKPFTVDVALDVLFDPRVSSSSPNRRSSWDVVLDCVDNAFTRYLLNDLCSAARIPLVSGAALKFEGQLATFLFSGDGPCRRCWWPTDDDDDEDTNSRNLCSGACAEFGVFGPVPGLIGTLQAIEAVKICSGSLQPSFTNGKLMLYDATDGSNAFRTIRMPTKKSVSCRACATRDCSEAGDARVLLEQVLFSRRERCAGRPTEKFSASIVLPRLSPEQVVHLAFSSANAADFMPPAKYVAKNSVSSPICAIVDVRPTTEVDLCRLPHTINLPFRDLLYDKNRMKTKLYEFLDSLTAEKTAVDEKSSNSGQDTRADKVGGSDASGHTTKQQSCIDLVILCRRGNDSQLAYPILTDFIKSYRGPTAAGDQSRNATVALVGDMVGGLDAWVAQVDKDFPMY